MSKRFCSNREASELFRLGSVILSLRLHGMYSGYAFHSQRAGANLCSTPWANRSRRDKRKGTEALETLYREKPGEYLRLTASVLPREFVFENVVTDLSDDDLERAIEFVRGQLSGAQEPPMID
jgi:hypothetical protein